PRTGISARTTLRGGGFTLTLVQVRGYNTEVRHALGVGLPPGDTATPFRFTVPGGTSYVGLVHVFHQGPLQRVCLRGTAYVTLGQGADTPRVRVVVFVDGMVGRTEARVDLRVVSTRPPAHYYIYGHPRVQSMGR
ncbi:MAG: hypothetical protein M3Y74_23465, partial [Chloroflexota bacterium]|nr:hypothetical protein [Chloroflexota bacterium]